MASPGFLQALAAHQAVTPAQRLGPGITEAVERQSRAMRVQPEGVSEAEVAEEEFRQRCVDGRIVIDDEHLGSEHRTH
ncbi:hypothetical protein ACM614_07335 [Streptomyces sp. 12297]